MSKQDNPNSGLTFRGYTVGLRCYAPNNEAIEPQLVKVEINEANNGRYYLIPQNASSFRHLTTGVQVPADVVSKDHLEVTDDVAYATRLLALTGFEPCGLNDGDES